MTDMTVLDFFVLTLAASAVVDVWRNGSIFALSRAILESRVDEEGLSSDSESSSTAAAPVGPRIEMITTRLPLFMARMLNCPFCLSHHTPWILAVLFFLPALCLPDTWIATVIILRVPVYSLAATRLGTIINACVPAGAKYERDAYEQDSYPPYPDLDPHTD